MRGCWNSKDGDWSNAHPARSRPRRNETANDPQNAPAMKTFLHRRPTIGNESNRPSVSEPCEISASCRPLRSFPAVSAGALSIGAAAIGALSIGALAIGAVAIGRLVIGRLFIKKAKIGTLEVGTLRVGKLEVAEIAGRGAESKETDGEAKL